MRQILNPASPQFDWLAALEFAKYNEIDNHEFVAIEDAAAMWPTCACGQLCKSLPKNSEDVPLDEILFGLGGAFIGCVADSDWEAALSVFRKIEARTAELLGAPQTPNPRETEGG